MAMTVMVTLLFLMPLFAYTPNVVLSAIIIVAVIGLIDIPAAYRIYKMDKVDFLVCICAFLGVIFISVQEGLAIAVCKTNIKCNNFIYRMICELGSVSPFCTCTHF
jgi:sulfate transporter 3